MVSPAKRKFKNSGYSLFANLMSSERKVMKGAKKVARFNKVWSRDRNILTFDQSGKIFNVNMHEDSGFVKANVKYNSDNDA